MQITTRQTLPERVNPQTWLGQADRAIRFSLRHWLLLFNLGWGIFVFTPWLAPVLMERGYAQPAKLIYAAYSFTCHQLPERSYFLFGPKVSLTQDEIAAVWPDSDTQVGRRQFVGTPELGYKVAYSDRMVSLYTGMWVAGLLFALVRSRLKPLSLRQFLWMALPMAVDGTSHLIFDITGLGARESNAWLQILTGHLLPMSFYIGDAWGSFNSMARLVSGALFGVALVGLAFPYLDEAIRGDLAQHVSDGG